MITQFNHSRGAVTYPRRVPETVLKNMLHPRYSAKRHSTCRCMGIWCNRATMPRFYERQEHKIELPEILHGGHNFIKHGQDKQSFRTLGSEYPNKNTILDEVKEHASQKLKQLCLSLNPSTFATQMYMKLKTKGKVLCIIKIRGKTKKSTLRQANQNFWHDVCSPQVSRPLHI